MKDIPKKILKWPRGTYIDEMLSITNQQGNAIKTTRKPPHTFSHSYLQNEYK